MPSGTDSTTTSSNPTPTSTDAERNLDNIEPTLSRSVSTNLETVFFLLYNS